ncbi:MAG: tRNA pseudouridine(55) synthase TruB [Acutalibacteraceae bacterium]
MQGVILINKPTDFTSFDVIASLRRPLGTKKLGHTGTLDPMATGVLPVLVGKATRLCSLLPESGKEYIADFVLGIRTDTLDTGGKVTESSTKKVSADDLRSVLSDFSGETEQIPPMFSAVKVNGVRLHSLARKGVTVERKPRRINIYKISLEKFDEASQSGKIRLLCSSGTYVRSVIDDMGEKLGTYAAMSGLCRTMSHGFTLDECFSLDEVRNCFDESMIIPADRVLEAYPQVIVSKAQSVRFSNGGELDIMRTGLDAHTSGFVRVKNPDGKLLGLGECKNMQIFSRCLFD